MTFETFLIATGLLLIIGSRLQAYRERRYISRHASQIEDFACDAEDFGARTRSIINAANSR